MLLIYEVGCLHDLYTTSDISSVRLGGNSAKLILGAKTVSEGHIK